MNTKDNSRDHTSTHTVSKAPDQTDHRNTSTALQKKLKLATFSEGEALLAPGLQSPGRNKEGLNSSTQGLAGPQDSGPAVQLKESKADSGAPAKTQDNSKDNAALRGLNSPAEPQAMETSEGDPVTPLERHHANVVNNPRYASIPSYHVILEQLAHTFAYHSPTLNEKDDMGLTDETRALKHIGYRKFAVIDDERTGFQVTCFMPYFTGVDGKVRDPKDAAELLQLAHRLGLPEDFAMRPVLAFRGSDARLFNPKAKTDEDYIFEPDMITDLADRGGVGAMQWTANADKVKALCAQASAGCLGRPVDVTGHSLGGALAQRAAASLGALINDVVTFQAPGIGDLAAAVDPKKHASSHYTVEGDMISSAGGDHSPGTTVKLEQNASRGILGGTAHAGYPLAGLNYHRQEYWKTLDSEGQQAMPHKPLAYIKGKGTEADMLRDPAKAAAAEVEAKRRLDKEMSRPAWGKD